MEGVLSNYRWAISSPECIRLTALVPKHLIRPSGVYDMTGRCTNDRYEMGHTNLLLEQVLVVGLLIWLASLTRSVDCGMGLGIYLSINRISEGVPIHIRALVHFPSVPGL
ncbi:hypothetical protein VNO80_33830 [Phaseolus coccineus]|uniref:Uncharacterized protein n=1 Tax=Phaseolus coccineus TaxID=3886 RepID=A0AAN9L0Q6_PHACN